MPELVTIGIPCFNSERWVRAAIESALVQTHPATEVIVVDDGSTDESLSILNSFGDAIRIISTPHRGANHARNVILQSAAGEWIQYLDADDYLLPDKLAGQIRAANPDTEVIYGETVSENALTGEHSILSIEASHDVYSQWFSWTLPQTGGCLWRKSTLQRAGGWNEEMPCCQEHELYMRALQAGVRFSYQPNSGAVYRIWSEQTLCRRDPRLVIRIKTQLIDKMRKWLEEHGRWTEQHARTAGQACFEMARTLAKYDLREADEYVGDRRKQGLLLPVGPAAPSTYRWSYRLFGFAISERMANWRRSLPV